MEELNLVEILKDCPRDYKLYSPVFGNVRLLEVFTDCENPSFVIATGYPPMAMVHLSPNGKLTRAGECIVFPAKDQRDWSKFAPNAKPKFNAGDRIIDLTRQNNHVYEVLEVLEDRYRVTGFGTLWFGEQDDFALAPVQIEFVEPREMYWFVWRGECTMPLLDELVHLVDSAYKPVNILEGEVIYGCGDKIGICRNTPLGAALIKAVGIELRIKEK